ncbi:MAG: type II toxin-antitoxin system HicA family toxin [Candidatus Riflebacteria bacterium]|nr:type II toxin-antitoxin system HicA family toxin [Candidatus Riflebacteria bacterium]
MPPKIRELIKILKENDFVDRGGKGSHRNFLHPSGAKITISGNLGDDAKPYQEKEVNKVVREVQESEQKR